MKKRMIAILLTLAMTASMLSAAAVGVDAPGDKLLLRSDLAVISVELAGLEAQLADYEGQAEFADVPADADYAPYVTAAYAAGLLKAIGGTPLLAVGEEAAPAAQAPVALEAVEPQSSTGDAAYDQMREMRMGADVAVVDDAAVTPMAIEAPPADPGIFDPTAQLTQKDVVAFLLRYAGYKDTQLGIFPYDYEALATSVGLLKGFEYRADAAVTADDFAALLKAVKPLYDALHAENKEPMFVDGMAQPIFDYDGILRFCVYVETNYDTDNDGKLDLVKALVQLPKEVLTGMKVATIFEARPYIAGCVNQRLLEYGTEGYDVDMHKQPAARVPAGSVTTKEASTVPTDPIEKEKFINDYFYWNGGLDGDEWNYEDLTWYDYYLLRGFGVVSSAGIGTRGSEGFETCGSDLEIDAFQCIIEWLNGDPDRVAYSDKTNNNTITADWSNHSVGMTGRSYGGTTTFGLAATGVEGLKTIVPVAAIASWYDYTNSQGASNGKANYTEGLGFYCNSRFVDKADWATIETPYKNYMNQQKNDQIALNGNYGPHWENRDYTKDWANIKIPALIVHGLNDTNVQTKHFDLMYEAFQKAGQNVKLLLHQGTHLTPTKHNYFAVPDKTVRPDPKSQTGSEMLIGDKLYDEVLNLWYSHYLYGIENGAEDMATVTGQSNVDGKWHEYDTWNEGTELELRGKADAPATTTISSSPVVAPAPKDEAARGSVPVGTSRSMVISIPVTEEVTINGPVAVHVRASSDAFADPSKMSATLVDKNATPFLSFNPSDSYLPTTVLKAKGVWLGGGLTNFDLFEYKQTEKSSKNIGAGKMDLNNPKAGYDSASAVKSDTPIVAGQMYDYVIYLQPSLYTVVAGHTLELTISVSGTKPEDNYNVTIDNAATYASIPVYGEPKDAGGSTGGGGSSVTTYAITATAGENGSVTPTGKSNVSRNTNKTYTIKANEGYEIADVLVDGKSVGAVATYTFSKVEATHTISASFVKLEVKPVVPTANPFTDVAKDAFYYDAVLWANEKGITSGVSATAFAPATSCTRGQVVTFLWRAMGSPAPKGTVSPFTDVTDTAAYDYKAILWAAENGITSGTTATTFGSAATVTRAQFVTFLWRSTNKPAATKDNPFADMTDAAAFSYEAVLWAAENGVTSGTSATTFGPDASCQRGQVVTFLYRYLVK